MTMIFNQIKQHIAQSNSSATSSEKGIQSSGLVFKDFDQSKYHGLSSIASEEIKFKFLYSFLYMGTGIPYVDVK